MAEFFDLSGQVAIITGAGRGIGEGIAERLAMAGARVAIFDAVLSAAEDVAARLGGVAVSGDIRREADVATAIDKVEVSLGPVTILVNNAGITGRTDMSWNLSVEEYQSVFDVNALGTFLACRAVVPGMLSRGYGRIVNIASIAGKEGNPTLLPYSASKAAVIAMTKSLGKELAGKGNITVNAIAPAVIRTAMLDGMAPATVDYMIGKIPMGRVGKIEEVAALVHYLASREASFTTGQCYDISGGRATY